MEAFFPIIQNAKAAFGISGSKLGMLNAKEAEAWKVISTKKVETDRELKRVLFDDDVNPATYRTFRNRFEHKLFRLILSNEGSQGTDLQKKYFHALEMQAAAKKLLVKGFRQQAVLLAVRALRVAREYQFTEITLSLSGILVKHYGVFEGNHKRALEFHEICVAAEQAMTLEKRSEWLYTEVMAHFSNRKDYTEAAVECTERAIQELKDHIGQIDSPRFHIHAYLLLYTRRVMSYDYYSAIKVLDRALMYFNGLSYDHPAARLIFTNKLIHCYIQTGQLSKALGQLKDSKVLCSDQHHPWVRNQEKLIALSLHTANYEVALETVNEIKESAYFDSIGPEIHDKIKLYEFLIALVDGRSDTVRLAKTVNELPKYTEDRRAMHLPLLAGKLTYFAITGQIHLIADAKESIEKYLQRYVDENNERFLCFARLVGLLPIREYEKEKFDRGVKKYLGQLQALNESSRGSYDETEIIPYETLWSLIIDGLEKQAE